MRFILTCLVLTLCAYPLVGADANGLEEFTRDIPVAFVGIHDPGYVLLRYEDGNEIDAAYEGVDFSVLSQWEDEVEKEGKHRPVTLIYTMARGVEVLDKATKTRFRLCGHVPNHPIGYAVGRYIAEKDSSTAGMRRATHLGTKAWDAELNRIYKALGGAKNKPLRDAQRAWMAYRDAQVNYLQQNYTKKQGTIWPLICAGHVLEITKRQAILLQQVRDW